MNVPSFAIQIFVLPPFSNWDNQNLDAIYKSDRARLAIEEDRDIILSEMSLELLLVVFDAVRFLKKNF